MPIKCCPHPHSCLYLCPLVLKTHIFSDTLTPCGQQVNTRLRGLCFRNYTSYQSPIKVKRYSGANSLCDTYTRTVSFVNKITWGVATKISILSTAVIIDPILPKNVPRFRGRRPMPTGDLAVSLVKIETRPLKHVPANKAASFHMIESTNKACPWSLMGSCIYWPCLSSHQCLRYIIPAVRTQTYLHSTSKSTNFQKLSTPLLGSQWWSTPYTLATSSPMFTQVSSLCCDPRHGFWFIWQSAASKVQQMSVGYILCWGSSPCSPFLVSVFSHCLHGPHPSLAEYHVTHKAGATKINMSQKSAIFQKMLKITSFKFWNI